MMSRSLKNFTFVGSGDRGGVEVMIWWFTGVWARPGLKLRRTSWWQMFLASNWLLFYLVKDSNVMCPVSFYYIASRISRSST